MFSTNHRKCLLPRPWVTLNQESGIRNPLTPRGRRGTALMIDAPAVSISDDHVQGPGFPQSFSPSIPWCCPPISSFVCLVFSSPELSLEGWFLIVHCFLSHVRTTSVFSFSLWSGGLHSASYVVRSFCALLHLWCGLCMRCQAVFWSTSFPLQWSFFACIGRQK